MYTREKYRQASNGVVPTQRLRLFDYISEVLTLQSAQYIQVPTEFLSTEYLQVLEIPEHLGVIPNPYALGVGARSLEDYPKVLGVWVQPDKFVFEKPFTGRLQLLRKTALDRPVQESSELLSAASLDKNFQQCLHITQELLGDVTAVYAPRVWLPPEVPVPKPRLDVLLYPEYIRERALQLLGVVDWHARDYKVQHKSLNQQLRGIFDAALAELQEHFDVHLIEPLRDVYISNVQPLERNYRARFVDIGDPSSVGGAGTLDNTPMMYFNGSPAKQLKNYSDRPLVFSTQRWYPTIGNYINYFEKELAVLVYEASVNGTARGYCTLPSTRVQVSMTGGLCYLGSVLPPQSYVQQDNAAVPVLVPIDSTALPLNTVNTSEVGARYAVEYAVFTDARVQTYNKVPLLELGYTGSAWAGDAYEVRQLERKPLQTGGWRQLQTSETFTAFYGQITPVYKVLEDAVGEQRTWLSNPVYKLVWGMPIQGMGVPAQRLIVNTSGESQLAVFPVWPEAYKTYDLNAPFHIDYPANIVLATSRGARSTALYAITSRSASVTPIPPPSTPTSTSGVLPKLAAPPLLRDVLILPPERSLNDMGGLVALSHTGTTAEPLASDTPAFILQSSPYAAWRIFGDVVTYYNPRTAGTVGDDAWQLV